MVFEIQSVQRRVVSDAMIFIDDAGYKPGDEDLLGKPIDVNLEIAIHRYGSGRIIVHHPGCLETAEGYKRKYETLGDFLQEKDFAVIRADNFPRKGVAYYKSMFDDLRAIIQYAVQNSEEICSSKSPKIYMMGFSGGANSIATVAHEYPQIEKILLMGPGFAFEPITLIQENLSRFTGEVYVVQGKYDTVDCGQTFYDMATGAKRRKLEIIPNCDHRFRHKVNDKIYSKAPLWAFNGDTTFPNPDGGVRLVRK